MTQDIQQAVQSASDKWQAAFNAGDAAGCAACYEEDAVIIANPFGEFKGRESIKSFWQGTINEGYKDITYINPSIKVIDDKSAVISANWTMNKAKGVITKELWVLQPDGTALLREDRFEMEK